MGASLALFLSGKLRQAGVTYTASNENIVFPYVSDALLCTQKHTHMQALKCAHPRKLSMTHANSL